MISIFNDFISRKNQSENIISKKSENSDIDTSIEYFGKVVFKELNHPKNRLDKIKKLDVLISKNYAGHEKLQSAEFIKIKATAQLLILGIVPKELWGLEILNAVKQGQFYLIKLLVEAGQIKKINQIILQKILQEIIQHAPSSWSQWFINKMVENGHDIKNMGLVEVALEKKDYAMAAFLIHLGAQYDQQGSEADGLRHYAECLKKGTAAEKAYRALLNPRNLGHLAGDAIIKEMVDDNGKELEGNLASESLTFLTTGIDFAAEQLEGVNSDALQNLSRKLKQAANWALRMESIACLKSDQEIASALSCLESDLIRELDKLQVGESIVIPAGWTSGKLGHAILMECTMLSSGKFEIHVINTGEGANYHGGIHDSAKLHLNTVRTYRISKEELINHEVFRRLLEPNVAANTKRAYHPEDFYIVLDPFFVNENLIDKELFRLLRKAQLSGTCSLRCLLAYSKQGLPPDQYNKLKFVLTESGMAFSIEQNEGLLDKQPALAKLLSLIMPQLFHTLTKKVKEPGSDLDVQEEVLAKLDIYSEKLKESIPQPISENKTAPLNTNFRTQSTQRSGMIQQLLEEFTSSNIMKKATEVVYSVINAFRPAKKVVTLPLFDANNISIKSLDTYLNGLSIYVEQLKTRQEVEDCITGILISIGREFIQNEAPFKAELKNHPDMCERIIANLNSLTNKLREDRYGEYPVWSTDNPARSIAIVYSLITAWDLSLAIEESRGFEGPGNLRNYRLNLYYLMKDQNSPTHDRRFDWMDRPRWQDKLSSHALLNPQLEQDIQCLNDYVKRQNIEKKSFFNYKQYTRSFSLKSEKSYQPEFDYAAEHAKHHTDWRKADTKYQSEIIPFAKPDVDKEEWRIHWFYANGVPNYFKNLRQLAFRAANSTLGGKAPVVLNDPLAYIELCLPKSDALTKDKRNLVCPTFDITNENDNNFSSKYDELRPFPSRRGQFDLTGHRTHKLTLLVKGDQNHLYTSENIIDRELLSIRCSVGTVENSINSYISSITAPLLIDFFNLQHIDGLVNVDQRIFFEATLFASQRLPLALQTVPNFANELNEFFKNAVIYFEDRVTLNLAKGASVDVVSFLYTQWQRALQYMQHEGIHHLGKESVSDLMVRIQTSIKKLIKDPNFQQNTIQQELLFTLLDSYQSSPSGKPSQDQEQVKDILICLASTYKLVQSNEISPTLTPAFIRNALQTPVKQRELIETVLRENPKFADRVFQKIAKIRGIILPKKMQWKQHGFPLYVCEFQNQILEFNVLTGCFLRNKKELLLLPSNTRKQSESYKELFGTKGLEGIGENEHFFSTDHLGKIEIITSSNEYEPPIKAIKREIEGKWYFYIGKHKEDKHKHPPMPRLAGLDNLSLWVSGETPCHYLFVDPKTLTPIIRLDENADITFLQKDKNIQWEWVDEHEFEKTNLHLLDPSAFILQENTYGFPCKMILQFPGLKDPSGQTIEFEREVSNSEEIFSWTLKNHPNICISHDQNLPAIRNFNRFVILENQSGTRMAFLPIKPKSIPNEMLQADCIMVNIKDQSLIASDLKSKLFLAYTALTNAVTPEDYLYAMKWLRQAQKFDRYDAEELRLLGWIFKSQAETKDHTAHAAALRLFTTWLVQDNFKRNPQEPIRPKSSEDITLKSSKEEWQHFWEKTKGNLKEEFPKLTREYFDGQHHLPNGLHIQDLLSEQELIDWNLASYVKKGVMEPKNSEGCIQIKTEDIELLITMNKSIKSPQIPLKSRPYDYLKTEFASLLDAATSSDDTRRKMVEDQIFSMWFDTDTKLFSAILLAALQFDTNEEAKNLLILVRQIMSTVLPRGIDGEKAVESFRAQLAKVLEAYNPRSHIKISDPNMNFPDIPQAQILPPQKTTVLPTEIPVGGQVEFKAMESLNVVQFDFLFNKCFETVVKPLNVDDAAPFTFETEDPWLNEKLNELNEDYFSGIEKNQKIPRYQLKPGMEKLLLQYSTEISKQANQYSEKLIKERQQAIVDLANKPPSKQKEALLFRSETASGRRKSLTIEDCVGLFLQGNADAYQAATGLTDPIEIEKLHNQIGDYILFHNKANRYHALVKAFKCLEKVKKSPHTEEQLAAAYHKIGEELSVNKAYDPFVDPRALMVFEFALNLTLRQHQVDGIRDMLQKIKNNPNKFQSVLLQRIQAGGKSLVFGHIMALLKADGYHLSVHVPATSQYATAINDMKARSEHAFGQRERTLVFDDDPLKFTPEYLSWMKTMLMECIVNREYVTITNESLRALRCKYLKIRFEIMKRKDNVDELEKSNQILKEILHLFRKRGRFTFDEMHLAFDPLKELNMPYGNPTYPKMEECQLISKIIQLAVQANHEDKKLLDPEHSSSQAPEQYEMMKQQIIEELMKDPEWNDPEIAAFLSGKTLNIPSFLEKSGDKKLCRLVILAHELLADNWLQERLNTNVNEDHGIPKTGFPRISIPFLSNMNPAFGSEFSDEYVITINTLLAYLVTGLNEEQIKQMIEINRSISSIQKRASEGDGIHCSIQQTPVCKEFEIATGFELFKLDLENADDILKVKKSLKNRSPESIKLLLDYVIQNEISKVELYENQVCSNGQNVASMAESFVAYGASMENPNAAPLGSIPLPEKGTNGQTIDLLIRQKTEVVAVDDDDVKSLFTMMKGHPRSKDISAIIDVGAYFRGFFNEEVAKMICEYLNETGSERQGVLFLDAFENLCFMQRDQNTVKRLSMTTPEVIEAETGFKQKYLFTYLDQSHITGMDISQTSPDAGPDENPIGIMTVNDQTEIHEELQGGNRMRGLKDRERLIVAVPKSSIESINQTLKKVDVKKVPSIKDVLLHGNIKEVMGQKGVNMLFCLQKMEDLVQQLILDMLYEMDLNNERAVFEKCACLFEKSVAIDLFKEYAHERKTLSMEAYLEIIKNALAEPLREVLNESEITNLKERIDNQLLTAKQLKDMHSHITVASGFNEEKNITAKSSQNRTTTRVQFKQQERQSAKVQAQDQQNLNEFLNEVENHRNKYGKKPYSNEIRFTKNQFFSKEFGEISNIFNEPSCWGLNTALKFEGHAMSSCRFDERLLTTNNAAIRFEGQVDLTGPFRKKPWPLLVICDKDPNGKESWKVMLCDILDGMNFTEFLSTKKVSISSQTWEVQTIPPEGREMWMIRANGKPIAGPSELEIESNPELAGLMTQMLFFIGDFQTLSYKPWKGRLETWIGAMEEKERKEWIDYFEKEILMGPYPGYSSSPLYRYFHPKS